MPGRNARNFIVLGPKSRAVRPAARRHPTRTAAMSQRNMAISFDEVESDKVGARVVKNCQ